jgi:hypothetical protein
MGSSCKPINSGFYGSGSFLEVDCGGNRISIQCDPDSNGVCNLSVIGGTAKHIDQGSEAKYFTKLEFDRLISEAVVNQASLDTLLMEILL